MENLAEAFAQAGGFTLETDKPFIENTVPPVVPPVTPPVVPPVVPPVTPPVVPPVTPGAVPPVTPPISQSFEELLSANSNGKYKKLEDIQAEIQKGISLAYANEKVAKLNEYIKSGGKFEDFAKTQLTDYSKLDDLSKIKERMKLTETYLTNEEIDILVENEYVVSEESTEKEKQLVAIKRKKDGAEAQAVLLAHQQKWAVSDISPEEVKAKADADFETWKNTFHAGVDAVTKIEVPIGEKDVFTFDVPAEANKSVKDKYTQLNKFWDRYTDASGKDDTQKLARDLYILDNFDQLMKAATGFARTKGREEVISERKNPDYVAPNAGSDTGVLSLEDQVAMNMPKFNR